MQTTSPRRKSSAQPNSKMPLQNHRNIGMQLLVKNLLSISIMLATGATSERATAAPVVFLLAGQSNMAGVGATSGILPPYNSVQTEVKFWDNNQWTDLRGGFGETDKPYSMFGPEVSFGYTLHNTIFPNDDIYLVKYGAPGTSLAVGWRPNGTGPEYNTFKSMANAALQNLSAGGLSPLIGGMIWMQGETDAMNYSYATAYATNLTGFIQNVRNDFGSPDMPFVVGRILTYYGASAAANALVRAAQETVPGLVGNSSWINTDDLTMSPDYPGHYGAQGQIDLGVRFANQFAVAPEPSPAALIAAGSAAFAVCCALRKGTRVCWPHQRCGSRPVELKGS